MEIKRFANDQDVFISTTTPDLCMSNKGFICIIF